MDRTVHGYVIRHPGMEGIRGETPLYIFSEDPDELKKKFYEGFNPVYELYCYTPKEVRSRGNNALAGESGNKE